MESKEKPSESILGHALSPLTYGLVIKERSFRKMFLEKTIPIPYPRGKNFLVIYAVESKLTRITNYPIDGKEIWKFTILFRVCSPNIVPVIAKVLGTSNLVHTTGICEKRSQILIESYLTPDEKWESAERKRIELQKMPEIQGVLIEKIQLK